VCTWGGSLIVGVGFTHESERDKCGLVRFEVFTAVTMKNAVFWDVAPSTCVNRRSSETSVHTRSTRRHIPENGIPQMLY
jgi:hypothetical protein